MQEPIQIYHSGAELAAGERPLGSSSVSLPSAPAAVVPLSNIGSAAAGSIPLPGRSQGWRKPWVGFSRLGWWSTTRTRGEGVLGAK